MNKETFTQKNHSSDAGHHSGTKKRNDSTSRFRKEMLGDRPRRRKRNEVFLKTLLVIVAVVLISFIMLINVWD